MAHTASRSTASRPTASTTTPAKRAPADPRWFSPRLRSSDGRWAEDAHRGRVLYDVRSRSAGVGPGSERLDEASTPARSSTQRSSAEERSGDSASGSPLALAAPVAREHDPLDPLDQPVRDHVQVARVVD